MEPRLANSKKWTPLPLELQTLIRGVLAETLSSPAQASLGAGKWIVEGRLFDHEMLLRIGYLPKGSLKQNNFEVSIAYKEKPMEVIHTALDAAGSLFHDFLEAARSADGEVHAEDLSLEDLLDLPRVWKQFKFNETEVWMQYSTVNSELEAQADALLGTWDDGLVRGSDDEV